MQPSHIKYRVLAFLIDFLVISVMTLLVVYLGQMFPVIETLFELTKEEEVQINAFAIYRMLQSGIILEILVAFYLTFVPLTIFKGQTLGMRMFKVKIVSFSGQNVSAGSLFIRQCICLTLLPIFTLGLSIFIDLIVCIYRHDNLSLSDTISKTRVVDKLDY